MQLSKYSFESKINQLNVWVANYDIVIAILNKLKIKLNKDGTYPQRPFCNLVLEGCQKDEGLTRFYGYPCYKMKYKKQNIDVAFIKNEDDIGIRYGKENKYFYIGLSYLNNSQIFERHIEERIAHCEKQKAKDEQKLKDYPKVFKQLQKINALSLETWEVQELL